jgi:SAM-dependent methyltransferase
MTSNNHEAPELDWSGERYMPGMAGTIRIEHVHRYLLARELVRGRRVLDIACGEGYGTDLLAGRAQHVIGVDVLPAAVHHAQQHYRRPHVRFIAGDCAVIPLAAGSIDVVVSFETLEHVREHDDVMREIRRVLTADGLLIMSSPDRRQYSEIPNYHNPFHVRELDGEQFRTLLTSHFRCVSIAGQRVRAASIVGPTDSATASDFLGFAGAPDNRELQAVPAPLYLIGFASDTPLPRIATGFLDGGEFVWADEHAHGLQSLRDRLHAQETEAIDLRAALERQAELARSFAAEKAVIEEQRRALQEELDTARVHLEQSVEEHRRASEAAQRQLRAALDDLRLARQSLQARESELTATIASLESRLRIIETSHSWRLTAPLRALRRGARS